MGTHRTLASRLVLIVVVGFAAALVGCRADPLTAPDPANPQVAPDIRVRVPLQRDVDDAIGVTRNYLKAMRDMIASPQIHLVAEVQGVWAVQAWDAWTIDPCIPRNVDGRIVWVTRGVGDYLNLHTFPWSHSFGQFDKGRALACQGAAGSGTMVIDDATGEILGVYPGDHQGIEPEKPSPT